MGVEEDSCLNSSILVFYMSCNYWLPGVLICNTYLNLEGPKQQHLLSIFQESTAAI